MTSDGVVVGCRLQDPFRFVEVQVRRGLLGSPRQLQEQRNKQGYQFVRWQKQICSMQIENAGDLIRLSVDVLLSDGPVGKIVLETEIHPRSLVGV
jgi:hypothetical protein